VEMSGNSSDHKIDCSYVVHEVCVFALRCWWSVVAVVPPFKTYGKNRDLLKLTTDAR